MAIALKPRIYRQGLRWSLLPRNKVDTVTMQPVSNKVSDADVIATSDITSVTIDDTTYALPIPTTVKYNHINLTMNVTKEVECGKGSTRCVMASGSTTFHLEEPLPSTPTVKLVFAGTTYFVNRASKTYADYPGPSTTDIATWIYNNRNGSEEWQEKSTDMTNRGTYDDPTLIDYTKGIIPLFPFTRKLIQAQDILVQTDRPEEQDLLTFWTDRSLGSWGARRDNWTGASAGNGMVYMWPSKIVAELSGLSVEHQQICLKNKTVAITTQVNKIDDYTYTVDWTIPVRYDYAAASQYAKSAFLGIGSPKVYDLDNYAFLDRISKVTIQLSAPTMSSETFDLSYSLSDSGNLTDNVINEHPLSFDSNELITLDAYWGDASSLWHKKMPEYLLDLYKDGKYVIECSVPASWAIQNNVHVNTRMNVYLQGDKPVTRDGDICVFEVKIIAKIFSNNEFSYAIKLLEV